MEIPHFIQSQIPYLWAFLRRKKILAYLDVEENEEIMQGIILTQILRTLNSKQFHLRNVPAVLACKFCKKKFSDLLNRELRIFYTFRRQAWENCKQIFS